MDINSALNIVQFVEIYEKIWYNKSQRYYIQVAYDMTSEEKQTQEFNSFRNIPDSFKKIVIVNGTKKPWRNEEGFVIMGMKYFLLNADSLEF